MKHTAVKNNDRTSALSAPEIDHSDNARQAPKS